MPCSQFIITDVYYNRTTNHEKSQHHVVGARGAVPRRNRPAARPPDTRGGAQLALGAGSKPGAVGVEIDIARGALGGTSAGCKGAFIAVCARGAASGVGVLSSIARSAGRYAVGAQGRRESPRSARQTGSAAAGPGCRRVGARLAAEAG